MKLQALLLSVASLVLVVGCGKKNDGSGSTKFNRVNNNQVYQGTNSCNTNTWGKIYDQSSNESQYQQTVSAFTFRNDIGTISPYYGANTGVDFQMTARYQNGQLAQGSDISFKITDSYSLSGEGYISFKLQPQGGQGYGGQFQATFADNKGSVRLQGYRGTMSGQQVVYGQIYFSSYNGGDQKLGDFVIDACAVVGI